MIFKIKRLINIKFAKEPSRILLFSKQNYANLFTLTSHLLVFSRLDNNNRDLYESA